MNNGIVLVVSVSIVKDDKVLMIQEKMQKAYKQWGFPSGRIESGEDILQAACREVKEETGYDVKLTATTGVYNFISSLNNQVIMFHFIGEVTGGYLSLSEAEILDAKWVTLADLKKFDPDEIRDYNVIMQIVNQLEKDEIHPISLFKKQL